ncbi:MAG: prolyl oligopeptidase [Glaciecola sp.]
MISQIEYPESSKQPVINTYHNIDVVDNYQWLESQETEEVKDWIKAQNKLSLRFLRKISRQAEIEPQINKLMY